MKNKNKDNVPLKKEETTLSNYYFGKIEILEFEQLNLPQSEISVFASADATNVDGGMGGIGPGDMSRRAYTTYAPAF